MTDNFKEIGSLFGREGAGAGFAKQTDKESFTYAFAWPEGDTWATLTGYLNLDEQPEEYVRRVLQDGGFRSDWGNPDYDPIGDFKETAGDEYRIPLLKVLLREQLASRYEVANHFSTMNRARVELSAFIQNEGGAPTASRRRARYSRRTGYPCHAHRHRRTSARGDPSAG